MISLSGITLEIQEAWECNMYTSHPPSMWGRVKLQYCNRIHLSNHRSRSSHRRCSVKELILKISQISQKNTCVEVFILWSCESKTYKFIKKRLQHRCFPVNFAKFLRTHILKKTCFCRKHISYNTSHKFWNQSLSSSIINVVPKYLRQFLGTSFGVATLPVYCNIE